MPTREEVVRREVWFESGDRITEQERAELERNLRATGLFGAIDVRLEETGTPGEVDLVVDTRDRFSLIGSAGGSVVGEVTGYYVLVGETNLFGTGNSISLSASGNDEDESEFGIDYSDWQLFDTWHRLDVAAGATEEGPFVRAAVTRPFKHLQDPWSYGVAALRRGERRRLLRRRRVGGRGAAGQDRLQGLRRARPRAGRAAPLARARAAPTTTAASARRAARRPVRSPCPAT